MNPSRVVLGGHAEARDELGGPFTPRTKRAWLGFVTTFGRTPPFTNVARPLTISSHALASGEAASSSVPFSPPQYTDNPALASPPRTASPNDLDVGARCSHREAHEVGSGGGGLESTAACCGWVSLVALVSEFCSATKMMTATETRVPYGGDMIDSLGRTCRTSLSLCNSPICTDDEGSTRQCEHRGFH